MLPHVTGRPVSMQRFPDGIDGKGFFHKDIPDYFPAWIKRVEVPKAGGSVTHVVVCDADDARLPGGPEHGHAARLALARRPRLAAGPAGDRPRPAAGRRLRRGPRAPPAGPASSCASSGFAPFAQVTGSKGIHVWTPLRRRRRASRRCAAFARDLAPRARGEPPGRADHRVAQGQARRAASSWTRPATPTRRPPCRPTPCGRGPARRWPRRSSGTSCPTPSCGPTAGT